MANADQINLSFRSICCCLLTVLVRGWLAGWLDFGCLSVGVFRLSYLVEGQYWQYHM